MVDQFLFQEEVIRAINFKSIFPLNKYSNDSITIRCLEFDNNVHSFIVGKVKV